MRVRTINVRTVHNCCVSSAQKIEFFEHVSTNVHTKCRFLAHSNHLAHLGLHIWGCTFGLAHLALHICTLAPAHLKRHTGQGPAWRGVRRGPRLCSSDPLRVARRPGCCDRFRRSSEGVEASGGASVNPGRSASRAAW